MEKDYKSIYCAFDPYPSYKGSAIHIDKATQVFANQFGPTKVLTLQGAKTQDFPASITHQHFDTDETNYLKRGQLFSDWVDLQIAGQKQIWVAQFRDIWGGLPIVSRGHITSIFEVNGLPSIELVNRYPYLSAQTVEKIRQLEDRCLDGCSMIVCPSATIRRHLVGRGVLASKIAVIPNGADLPARYPKPDGLPHDYMVYFGALQPWQGVGMLIKAMGYLQDKPHVKLVLCSSHKAKFARPYQKLAQKLGLNDQLVWLYQLEKKQLHAVVQHAICTVAPLTECARNLEQGCSPLKIFESMACQTPVVAADLPVVREILEPDVEGKLFRPDRPAELARNLRLLIDYPDFGKEMAVNAFEKLNKQFTWKEIDKRLGQIYHDLLDWVY